MIEWINNIDTQAFLALNSLHAPYFDFFMSLFSGKWIWIPMYATILFAIVRNYRWKQVAVIVAFVALAIVAADQICASVIRPVVCRLRPANLSNPMSQMVHIVDGYRGGAYGFPSCHAANSFALAAFVAIIFRNKRLSLAIFGWALINSYSRIYLGVHYPGDLIVGGIIGAVCGSLTAAIGIFTAYRIDRPQVSESVNTGVVTSMLGITVISIAVASAFLAF